MKVDTMRDIDFYAGVPLCFLLTIFFKLISLLTGRKTYNKPQNVLLIELSEMGSAILVDPAMRKLQSELGAELHFLIFKKNKPSLNLLKTVKEENIFTIREDGLIPLVLDTLRFLLWARNKKIDTVIDLELFSRFTALLTGLSGATNRAGFHAFYNEGLYRGNLLTHKIAYNPHLHISKNFIAIVNALASDKQERPFSKTLITDDEITLCKAEIPPAAKEEIYQKIKALSPDFSPARTKIILVNTNASDLLPQRRWDRNNYITVVNRILSHDQKLLVLLTGSPAEKEWVQVVADAVNDPRCINFAGGVKFAELTTLYSVSAMMLTNDSGPAHFASVTEMHTFVIFGPETPALYGSLGNSTAIYSGLACSPCVSAANHRKTPCSDNVCLQVISPEQVFTTILPLLESLDAQGA
ncbi:MAG: glycosyltransferase family 9 protein [Proteobacteria bacterium]|nr:glycosyltransferase family 9 protein [Pseudomonadota bacterium]MBU1714846.1 glycosyltransferase family 9 protein [Pseudomonadota bacterium]